MIVELMLTVIACAAKVMADKAKRIDKPPGALWYHAIVNMNEKAGQVVAGAHFFSGPADAAKAMTEHPDIIYVVVLRLFFSALYCIASSSLFNSVCMLSAFV
jgi:hypothetical protein